MKIKQFKFKQILKLHLLKSRVYENFVKNKDSSFITDTNLTQIVFDFKKALQIIFKFHQSNKKILFVGLPQKLEKKINNLTNHAAVPVEFDLQGVISNTNTINFKSKANKSYFSKSFAKLLLPKLSKQPDLVVLVSSTKSQTIISESYVAKVPLIVFNNEWDYKNVWLSNAYIVNGIYNNASMVNNLNIFFVGLNFLFKVKVNKKNELSKFSNRSQDSNLHKQKRRFR